MLQRQTPSSVTEGCASRIPASPAQPGGAGFQRQMLSHPPTRVLFYAEPPALLSDGKVTRDTTEAPSSTKQHGGLGSEAREEHSEALDTPPPDIPPHGTEHRSVSHWPQVRFWPFGDNCKTLTRESIR